MLKDVQAIIDSDVTDDEDEMDKHELLNTPCPNPDVNLVCWSSDNNDSSDNENAMIDHSEVFLCMCVLLTRTTYFNAL